MRPVRDGSTSPTRAACASPACRSRIRRPRLRAQRCWPWLTSSLCGSWARCPNAPARAAGRRSA